MVGQRTAKNLERVDHNLVQTDRAAAPFGSRFVLQVGTAHIVRRALEVSGLLDRLNVVHTRAAAVAQNPRNVLVGPDRVGGRAAIASEV